jgi:hypothetical protein
MTPQRPKWAGDLKAEVPYGESFVHLYGTRTLHRGDVPAKPQQTRCGEKVGRIDDTLTAGDVLPHKWSRWRLCPKCFRD